MSSPLTLLLAGGAATFFVIANWIMKEYASAALPLVIPAAAIVLALGAVMETEALKLNRLGHIIVLILAFEIAGTVALSILIFGESYNAREILGVTVIGLGILIISSAASARTEETGEFDTVRQHIANVRQTEHQHKDL